MASEKTTARTTTSTAVRAPKIARDMTSKPWTVVPQWLRSVGSPWVREAPGRVLVGVEVVRRDQRREDRHQDQQRARPTVPLTSMKRWTPCDCLYGAAILLKMLPRLRGGSTTGALSGEPVTVVVAVIVST